MDQETPMTIEILMDPRDEDFCIVRIDNNVSPVEIETRVAVPKHSVRHWTEVDVSKVEEWVREIKNSPDKIIGVTTEYEIHYKNNNDRHWCRPRFKVSSSTPYDILQFCVGNQCLLYNSNGPVPKALKDVLSSGKFTVVGVGMEEIAKNLEENLGLKISRARDLRKMAESAQSRGRDMGGLNRDKKKGNLEVVKLAESVLKEGWAKWTNRNGLSWCKNGRWTTLSAEKVKYGTLDAFLVFKMGKELIEYA